MRLVPMTQEDFDLWSPRSRKTYAQEKMKANGYSQELAKKLETEEYNRLLPNGLRSNNNYLYSFFDDSKRVGFIWFHVQNANNNRVAFIYDLIVEPKFRGQGYGKKIMQLIENEILAIGVDRVSLHVFGSNKTAISLYQSLGYQTIDLVMEKKL